MLEFFAEDLDPAEDADLLVLLFDHLTEPRLSAEPPFEFDVPVEAKRGPRVQIEVRGDAGHLQRLWTGTLKQHLARFTDRLLPAGEQNLRRAGILSQAATGGFDLVSLHRSAIADDEDDEASRHYHGIHCLIDATRDMLSWKLADQGRLGLNLATGWSTCDIPILRRIGIHVISEADGVPPETKLDLCFQQKWLQDDASSAEALRFLETTYPQLEANSRRRLVEETRLALTERASEADDPREQGWRRQRLWGTLQRLHKAAPDCELAKAAIAELEDAFPELRPRERPTKIELPSEEDLLGWAPRDVIAYLEKVKKSPYDPLTGEDHTEAFLRLISTATAKNLDWSYRLAESLAQRGRSNSPIWRSILRTWEEADLTLEHWFQVTTLLEEHMPAARFHDDIAGLLEKRITKLDEAELSPEAFIDIAIPVGRRLLDQSSEGDDRARGEHRDWLNLAINRSAGKLALFTVNAASHLRKAHGTAWIDSARDLFGLIDSLLSPPMGRSRLGRPVLCSQFRFFFHNRPTWTQEKILPLFDWDQDQEAAAQAWNGFITWGRYSPEVWKTLLPHLIKTFDHLEDLGELRRSVDGLARHLAGVAFYLDDDPVESGWLQVFLGKASEGARKAWAYAVLETLETLDPEKRHDAWDRWLREYVQQRLDGRPTLGEEEWEVMHDWVLYLEQDLDEVVNFLTTKRVRVTHFNFLLPLSGQVEPRGSMNRDALFDQPDTLAQFLEHVLTGNEIPPWHRSDLQDCLVELGNRGVGQARLRRLADLYRESGGTISDELQALLDHEPSGPDSNE